MSIVLLTMMVVIQGIILMMMTMVWKAMKITQLAPELVP